MKIKISADSTCDLSKELIEKYGIEIVPLYIVKGDVALKDGVEIVPGDIYEYVESGAGVCKTSAASIGDYEEVFTRLRKEYDAVIHFNISSEMSACHKSACLAAEELDNVFVIDSRNLSTGIGHFVLDAAVMAQEGKPADEIYNTILSYIDKMEASFVIDTLKYLHKGGRCSGVAALGANLLKLKPCIEVKDGKMDVGKKYRGNFGTVILQYVRDRLKNRDDIDTRRLFITYADGTPSDVVDAVEAEVKACIDFDEIHRSFAGCTVSCHCGPVCLGVLFFRK